MSKGYTMKNLLNYARLAVLPIALAMSAAAQEPGITRQQADRILDELRQIRTLLERPSQAAQPDSHSRVKLDLTAAPVLGTRDAPVTLVEFTDYQCPFCQKFHSSAFQELKRNYIDTGRLRFYSRDLPLEALHPEAHRAAQAARCAGDQGAFWNIRDLMASHPAQLAMDNLIAYAAELGLNVATFRGCIAGQKYKELVQKDLTEAEKIGAGGTPAFVLGKSTPEGVEGDLFVGAVPYVVFEQKLKQLLAAQ
jgi:protein-disulfide isomerase